MTQGELERIPEKAVKLFSDLEMRIMDDIVRRIKINGFSTASADWQMTRLQQLGKSEEDIKEWIRLALEASEKEIEKIFADETYKEYMKHERAYTVNGMQQVAFKDNQKLQSLIFAVQKQTGATFRNITQSMGFVKRTSNGKLEAISLTDFYRNLLDAAIMDIQSGAFDYQTVLKRTINDMTTSGIRFINYGEKRRDRVDVACRRAIMTGFRQVQGHINEQVAEELNTDSYEVTYHVGARPDHQPWQGKVWTMQQLIKVCGLGTVEGLHGANCYHDYRAFIPGISVRAYSDAELKRMIKEENKPKRYNGKEYTTYEALQEQRRQERNMRKVRQDIHLLREGGGSEEDIMLKRANYHGKMQKYLDFSKEMKLPTKKDRIYQDGLKGQFDISEKQYKNAMSIIENKKTKSFQKNKKSDIMMSGARITDLFSKEAEEFAEMYYKEIRSFSTDSGKIAKNLGKNEEDIEKIKRYLFVDVSLYDEDTGEYRRFDADCAIAQSWQRLMNGKDIKKHDKILIEHELLEMKIKEENPGIDHRYAHELATEKYNYPEEAQKYYGDLKKHKKDKQ